MTDSRDDIDTTIQNQIASVPDLDAIAQDDTFFACPNGRLKLHGFGDGHGELIFYRRTDQTGPKTSFYRITTTTEPDRLCEMLTLAHSQTERVIRPHGRVIRSQPCRL